MGCSFLACTLHFTSIPCTHFFISLLREYCCRIVYQIVFVSSYSFVPKYPGKFAFTELRSYPSEYKDWQQCVIQYIVVVPIDKIVTDTCNKKVSLRKRCIRIKLNINSTIQSRRRGSSRIGRSRRTKKKKNKNDTLRER